MELLGYAVKFTRVEGSDRSVTGKGKDSLVIRARARVCVWVNAPSVAKNPNVGSFFFLFLTWEVLLMLSNSIKMGEIDGCCLVLSLRVQ